ncbi:trehalose-phosphatase [Salinisphaera sp. SPP-AMP-43]|uniref:trehalose-phosphatase n=1 Tax=Salinisphaera sp. SPP-AMP-43 TaxID=3121288 RepID=UPI003C6DC75B
MTTLPKPAQDWAIFLDVDGTLIHIAEHPDSVQPSDRLGEILEQAAEAVDGALALISGRSIAVIDALTEHAAPAAAGLHGLEIRTAEGEYRSAEQNIPALQDAREQLESLTASHSDLFIEDKKATLALHYRGASEAATTAAQRTVESIVAASGGELSRLDGKSVYEIKPAHGDKGHALHELLATPSFSGRRPVYVGDDVTDEAAFRTANELGGVSIRVGADGASEARYRLNTVDEVLEWLEATARTLGREIEPRT